MNIQEAIEAIENGEEIDLADLCANLLSLPDNFISKGLHVDENGNVIEDFSYLKKFED
jgi:hypothetical protein